MKAISLLATVLLLVGRHATAGVFDVCSTGCAFNAVQPAIDAAADGDTIRVAQGRYVGILTVRKNITLLGGYSGPPDWQRDIHIYVSKLDGDTAGSVLTISGDVSPIVDGFTFTRGKAYNGGGVNLSGGSPKLSNNIIESNRARNDGGGVAVSGGSPVLSHNTIQNNHAIGSVCYYCYSGAGGGVAIIRGSPTLNSNTIRNNEARYGGGVAVENDSAMLSHNSIKANRVNRTVSFNYYDGVGGGIWIIGRSTKPKVDGNLITENSAFDGGGVFVNDSSGPVLTNNIICKNGARSNGDGIYIDWYSRPRIINNTIMDNNLAVTGRATAPEGVFLFNYPSPVIVNNIVTNHGIASRGGSGFNADRPYVLDSISVIDYNDVWGNLTANYHNVPCGPHDISDDPRFIDSDTCGFRVQPNSIVIDKGTSEGAPPADFEGDMRPYGKGIDIGADEETTNAAQPPEVPTLVYPLDGSIDAPRYLGFKWNASSGSGPISYRLQVSTDPCFPPRFLYNQSTIERPEIPDTLCVLRQNLSAKKVYFWRVSASNGTGTSSWSEVWSFTTTDSAGTPWLDSPPDNAIVQLTTLTLSWNYDFSATYRLQVSTDSSFKITLLDSSGIAPTLLRVGPLDSCTTYYWRVQATNINGPGPWSEIWRFTTVPLIPVPGRPILEKPLDRAMNQPTYLILKWKEVVGADSYRLQVAANSNFSPTIDDVSGIRTTSWRIGPLAKNTTYFWHVQAENICGAGPWSADWRFSTTGLLPEKVVLLSPTNDAVSVSDEVQFTWQENDPTVTKFWFELATDSSMANAIIDSALVATDTTKVLQLLDKQTYWWRVKAKDAEGWSHFSEQRRFRIDVPTNIQAANNVPKEFSLSQNFPNPFNPSTTIEYTVTIPSHVELKVYDILGNEVMTLVDDKQPAGKYRVQLGANALPNGLYFYRIKVAGFVQTKKLTVLK